MSPETRISASVPFWIALLCIAILAVVLLFSAIHFPAGTEATTGFPESTGSPAITMPVGICPAAVLAGPPVAVIPDTRAQETIVLSRPPADDRVQYTDRGFSEPVEASIAWWMSPGFMDNTTEFRGYERTTPEAKAAYPEEHRIFFSFIEHRLDSAESSSIIRHDTTLFRGISPFVAGTVINTSEYREPAFASTSYDISFSLDAFAVRSPDGYRNVLVLSRQPGDHALYINEDEREVLLPRGTDWSVVKAENVENLSVNADFPLHNRTTGTASFDQVRLIFIREKPCT
ncbi:hypothetical protein [Methanoregula sp.]|jgi:hypothetical protein|uniref:hypothetical protein n=1 Tax=Methanoregula sp. TaxID=2052170 RepID=UPI003C290F48